MARRSLLALLAAAALAGCGGDEVTTSPSPTEQPAPEEQEGGAGDEEAARVPVRFEVGRAGIVPPQVSVPAFLAIELIVTNELDEPVEVRLEGAEPFIADPGAEARAQIDGRRPGRYVVDFGDERHALLITGAEPGP